MKNKNRKRVYVVQNKVGTIVGIATNIMAATRIVQKYLGLQKIYYSWIVKTMREKGTCILESMDSKTMKTDKYVSIVQHYTQSK